MKRGGSSAAWFGVALAGAASLLAQSTPSATPSAVPTLTIPAGTRLILELEDTLHTRSTKKDDTAHFVTAEETRAAPQPGQTRGPVALPAGTRVRATVTKVKKPGRAMGRAEINLRFDEVLLPDGSTLQLDAALVRAGFHRPGKDGQLRARSEGGGAGRDAVTVGTNAALGALFGARYGKKGAAYGAGVGAGIGLLSILLERGPHLELPAGMLAEVELKNHLEVPQSAAVQLAQAASPPAPAPAVAGGSAPVTAPADSTGAATAAEEAPPDFNDAAPADTTSLPAPGAPAPPPYDPTLDDPDAYRLKVDVQLVLVEAFVRNASGRGLESLTRDDFILREDGARQEIKHFSRDELPLAVALVVDRSGSVAPFMPELRRAAYDTLRQLKPGDRVALFAFDQNVQRLENLTTDRGRIAERIARIQAGGGTNITDALFEAAYYLAQAAPRDRRAIILISDNQATVRGQASQEDTVRFALESDVVVYSVQTQGEPAPLLQRLPGWLMGAGSVRRITEETGGEIIDVDEAGSLQAALAGVIARLKTRYTLGYAPTNDARDTRFRSISVQLAERFGRYGLDYTVHARRGYYPAGSASARQTVP